MSLFKPYRFYSKTEIECKALDLLYQMECKPNFAPKWPFDASLVADFLDLGVVWDFMAADDVGPIAARILPSVRLIEINEQILNKPPGFQQSTIAHEIGHWILHINHSEVDGTVKQLEFDFNFEPASDSQSFVCRSAGNFSKIQSIEWQAQYFATCLLMPRMICLEKCQDRDLTKWTNLYEIAEELGVTISNLNHRLKDLGLIHIPEGSREIYLGSPLSEGQIQLFAQQ